MTQDAQAELSVAVQAALAPAAAYAAAVMRSGTTSAEHLLNRPDIDATLAEALTEARLAASQSVRQAWEASGGTDEAVIAHLLTDISRIFTALPHLHATIRAVYPRGSGEVEAALNDWARKAALRARMTVSYAAGAAAASVVLADARARQEAGELLVKRWQRDPSSNSCFWCRRLDGVTIALDADFRPYLGGPVAFPHQQERKVATPAGARRFGQDIGSLIVYTSPPRPYLGTLPGPLLHPECACKLVIVRIDSGSPPAATSRSLVPEGFLSSADIRNMPEAAYRSLTSFLDAAVGELRALLRRLTRRG